MTNEELKKKIVEILDNNIRWQPYYYISRGIVYEDDLKNIAEALIEADIGDVSEWKHRAARAERALVNTCAILYAQGVESPYSDEEWQLQQAEKESQEGKKDE